MEINLDQTRCLVNKEYFTYTDVVNICTGTSTQVPHGTIDLIANFIIGIILFGLIAAILFVVGLVIYGWTRGY